MSSDIPNGFGSSYREGLRRYYDNLMQEAEEENRKREDELQRELMTEDPLSINYARWATEDEFKKDLAEISFEDCSVEQSGIPLFCSDAAAYVDTSDSHSLIIGSSGSKKTRLFILPSIYSLAKAGESMIITDPKAELYERTSGYLKKKGYKVYCVNFRDESINNAWNPLAAPLKFFKQGKFDLSVGLLNDFALISVPRDAHLSDPFWDDSARSVFMGLLLILFLLAENEDEVNIRSILKLRATIFKNTDSAIIDKILEIAGTDSLLTSYLSGISIAPSKTFGSIITTLDTHLTKFIIRPSLTDMLCHNEIQFENIGREKTAIYLVMPDEKQTYHGLISIFIQQCYEALIFEAQKCAKKTLPVRVNFILDEFSSLPQIKEFPSMISAARSRNIRFNIVVQSEKQLRARYSDEADTIKGNCNNWIYLYSREFSTLSEISELCGTQKSGKPLVTPSRLQRLDKEKGEALIMHGRKYPFISLLKDVNIYDREDIQNAYHEKCISDSKISLFDIVAYINAMNESYIHDRLRNNNSSSPINFNKYTDRLCINDLFQTVADETCDIYNASAAWFAKHIGSVSPDMTFASKNIFFEIINSSDNTIYTRAPMSVRVLPDVIELADTNIAVISDNSRELQDLSKELYAQLLVRKKVIPLYYDFHDFDIPLILNDIKKEQPALLPLLIAQKLYDIPLCANELNPNSTLMKMYNKLLECFNSDEAQKYTVILYALDEAPFLVEAVYQSWELGAYKNVRIVVFCSDKGNLLDTNCGKILTYNGMKMFSNLIAYFDKKTNEVMVRQKDSPKLRIMISENK